MITWEPASGLFARCKQGREQNTRFESESISWLRAMKLICKQADGQTAPGSGARAAQILALEKAALGSNRSRRACIMAWEQQLAEEEEEEFVAAVGRRSHLSSALRPFRRALNCLLKASRSI